MAKAGNYAAARLNIAQGDYEKVSELLTEMAAALEACLDCKGLDFTAEHDAEVSLNRYRAMARRKKA